MLSAMRLPPHRHRTGVRQRGRRRPRHRPREELFATTKIQDEIKDHSAALASITEPLNKLGLDYLDLVIIHSPQSWAEFRADSNFDKENLEVWRALEQAQAVGRVRSIGVSNFLKSDLHNILDHGSSPPAVNQVLAHVTNIPTDLIAFAKSHHITTQTYSLIAHGAALNIPELKEIAERYGVTVPQLCIRYTLQLGLIALPKSATNEHIESNADVEFEISDADMETLNNLPPLEDYGEDGFFPVFDKAAANRKA